MKETSTTIHVKTVGDLAIYQTSKYCKQLKTRTYPSKKEEEVI
jgi:hypothetical protein